MLNLETEHNSIAELLIKTLCVNPWGTQETLRDNGLWAEVKALLQEPLFIELARKDPNAFIEYVMIDPETRGAVMQQEFHREWQTLIGNEKSVLIVAPRGHGKCGTSQTRLICENGLTKTVGELPLNTNIPIWSWTETRGYEVKNARVWQSTVQDCVAIKTRCGRSIEVSLEHPFWTPNGWKAAGDLVVDDRIPVCLGLPCGQESIPLEKAWLLGYSIGNGCLTQSNWRNTRIKVCPNPLEFSILKQLCATIGYNYKATPTEFFIYDKTFTSWIDNLGLRGHDAYAKFIPDEVFTWDKATLGAFIQGYFDADGSACVTGLSYRNVELSSASELLIQQIQSLLLRLNVTSMARIKYVKGKPYHILTISTGSIQNFREALPFKSRKRDNIDNFPQQTCNENLDVIPDEIVRRLPKSFSKLTLPRLDSRRKHGHLRSKILRREDLTTEVKNNASLMWDYVTKVTFTGAQQTYSVEVDDTHTHITNDFVTHNTIQLVGRGSWEIGSNPDIRIKIIGSTDDKAKEIVGLIRDLIQNSEAVHRVFPDLIIDTKRGDTQTKFFVERPIAQRDPTVEASGVLAAGAGGRADLLICDDVVDMKNSVINPAQREQVIRTVKETWFSLVSASGRKVWIATPYHVADATHNLKDTGTFSVWWRAAHWGEPLLDDAGEVILDENGRATFAKKYLWPDKWDEATLALREKELGPRVYARQYLLNAMSDEERTFPEESIAKSFDYSLMDFGDGIPDDWPTFGGIDLASALGKKNAYTVIWTLAMNPENGKLYMRHMWRRRAQFNEILWAIRNEFEKYKWRLCFCESNAFQSAVIDALEASDKQIPIQGFTTGVNKNNELIGLPGLNVAFEKGFFAIPAAKFPLASDDSTPLAIFMNELRTYPGGEFSDTIMSLWFAYRAAIAGSSPFEDNYLETLEVDYGSDFTL